MKDMFLMSEEDLRISWVGEGESSFIFVKHLSGSGHCQGCLTLLFYFLQRPWAVMGSCCFYR